LYLRKNRLQQLPTTLVHAQNIIELDFEGCSVQLSSSDVAVLHQVPTLRTLRLSDDWQSKATPQALAELAEAAPWLNVVHRPAFNDGPVP
jgi:hypothetical protein